MPQLPPPLLIFYGSSILAGVWVAYDGQTRLPTRPAWERFVWGVGTAVALPVFLPMYLLGARSPDRSGIWGPAEMLAIAVFFAISLPLVAGLLGLHPSLLSLRDVSLVILIQNLGFVLLAVLGIALRYRLPLARLGLHGRRWAVFLGIGVLVGGLMIPVSIVAERAAVQIVGLVEGRETAEARAEREHHDPINRVLESTRQGRGLFWLIALLALAVPIGEEIYFRGVVYGGLRHRYGVGWALAGSTLFFGLVHQQVIHFLPIAVLGLAFALLYERTKSLVPAITVHAVNNVIAVLAQLYGWNI
ncbi:MAG: CPBP family intramembrane metalloprotease [Armatimonadetes bacterium]|nr:CPBP family intramembrane metalloprotease [Armatimonadota bacterium]